jgi:hypothetical protein
MYRTKMKHKTTANHNTNVIMEFVNLSYVSGPSLSGIYYLCSKIHKYIMIVPKGYNNDLVVFYQIS